MIRLTSDYGNAIFVAPKCVKAVVAVPGESVQLLMYGRYGGVRESITYVLEQLENA